MTKPLSSSDDVAPPMSDCPASAGLISPGPVPSTAQIPPEAAVALARARRRTRGRVLAVSVVIIGAVGFLLYKGLGSAVDYYEPVNVALAHRAELGTSSFRIEGIVLPGSIAKVADGVEFRVEWANKSVPVVATSTPPSMFQPDMPVVLDGHFLAGTRAIFDCDQIMVKHSTVYQSSGPSTTLAPIPGNQ